MKNFLKIAAFVTLPVVSMIVLSLVAQATLSAPTAVSAITDSGEVWYNPISWALDESAEHATLQATKAVSLGVSYTQITALVGAMIAGIGLTLLLLAIRQGWVKAEGETPEVEQAPAAAHTPAQLPPRTAAPATSRSTSSEDERDPAFTGSPVAAATA